MPFETRGRFGTASARAGNVERSFLSRTLLSCIRSGYSLAHHERAIRHYLPTVRRDVPAICHHLSTFGRDIPTVRCHIPTVRCHIHPRPDRPAPHLFCSHRLLQLHSHGVDGYRYPGHGHHRLSEPEPEPELGFFKPIRHSFPRRCRHDSAHRRSKLRGGGLRCSTIKKKLDSTHIAYARLSHMSGGGWEPVTGNREKEASGGTCRWACKGQQDSEIDILGR
jgi:hypothetical protein